MFPRARRTLPAARRASRLASGCAQLRPMDTCLADSLVPVWPFPSRGLCCGLSFGFPSSRLALEDVSSFTLLKYRFRKEMEPRTGCRLLRSVIRRAALLSVKGLLHPFFSNLLWFLFFFRGEMLKALPPFEVKCLMNSQVSLLPHLQWSPRWLKGAGLDGAIGIGRQPEVLWLGTCFELPRASVY